MGLVSFKDPLTGVLLEYHIPNQLQPKWETLSKRVIKENDDRVFVVGGREGCGKSTFAFMQAKYIDPSFSIDRICFTPEQFVEQLQSVPKGCVVVFDEAFRGFSSKSALSKVNKLLVQSMMEVRRRNLIIFIVLPSFSMLEPYVAVQRSDAFFFISKRGAKKSNSAYRSWRAFGSAKKAMVYDKMKKNYGFLPKNIHTTLRGKFFAKRFLVDGENRYLPYETFDEQAYDAKKGKAFGVQPKVDEKSECELNDAMLVRLMDNIPIKSKLQLAKVVGQSVKTLYRRYQRATQGETKY